MGDSLDAVAAFDKAGTVPEKFKPIAAKAYSDRANALTESKEYAAAIVPAKKATMLSPGYEPFNALGVAELGSGDGKAAAADFEKSLSLAESQKSPLDRRAVVSANLAAAYAKAGDLDKAKTYAAQARRLDASVTGGYAALEHAFTDQANEAMTAGKYSDAAALFEQAAEIAPSDVAMLYTNAAFAHLQEKPKAANDKAKVDADRALAIDAKNAGANFAAGIALANQGKRDDALAYLGKADDAAKAGKDSVLTANIEKTIQQLNARKK
jgi:tetratricopeptide (TPR) repeat protein